VHIRVVYLDNSGAMTADSGDALTCHNHDFNPEVPAEDACKTVVHVLYRPGHYDILYPRS